MALERTGKDAETFKALQRRINVQTNMPLEKYAFKVIKIFIVKLDEFEHFIYIHYDRKIGTNCSKL